MTVVDPTVTEMTNLGQFINTMHKLGLSTPFEIRLG